jgi:hypothetical protein
MAYTTINKPSEYFNTKLYTGNSTTTNAITGVGFQPDWVWLKGRNYGDSHRLYDAVRGSSNYIVSNATIAQNNLYPLTSFDSDGFTIGSSDPSINGAYNYASWNWKANGSGSSNTDGSIASTVSANTTSGFSIVTWTGNSGSVGHGLGKKPEMIISKSLGTSGAWYTTHKSLSTEMQDNYMFLNTSDANTTNNNIWGGEPTISTFSVGSGLIGNTTHVAYCFNSVKGFSKFGSYVGNGNNDGTFVYTGFKPAFVMLKEALGASAGGSWLMIDNKRDTFNLAGTHIGANSSGAEQTAASRSPTFGIDFISNGFKLRGLHDEINTSDYTYIYMAFAENPLVGTNNIPATAR